MITHLSGDQRPAHREVFDDLFRLRYDVFVGSRRWSLATRAGRESDEYDLPEAQYFFGRADDGRIISHCRLTPTTHSLMADYFPHLVQKEVAIRHPRIMETTRLIVLPQGRKGERIQASKAALLLAVFEWAAAHGITHIQTVIEAVLYGGIMELLPQTEVLGLAGPYGGGPGVDGGGDAIALRCPVNHQSLADLRRWCTPAARPCETHRAIQHVLA